MPKAFTLEQLQQALRESVEIHAAWIGDEDDENFHYPKKLFEFLHKLTEGHIEVLIVALEEAEDVDYKIAMILQAIVTQGFIMGYLVATNAMKAKAVSGCVDVSTFFDNLNARGLVQ